MINRLAAGLILLLFFTQVLYAAPAYRISVKLAPSADTAILLAHYYGNKQYLDDTAFRNKQGVFVFEGAEKLKEGMYIIAGTNKTKYFDFFVTGNQQFEFACDPVNVVKTMQVKGSEENRQFYDYISFLGQKQKEIEPLTKQLKLLKPGSDSTLFIKSKIETIDNEVKGFIRKFYTDHKGTLAAAFVKSGTEADYLPYATKSDGKVDSAILYQVYKQHYFDNFVFADPRIIYTPVFSQKVDTYFDKLAIPAPDSLKKEIDKLMLLTSVNKDMQTYAAWYLSLKYETSNIMGQDAIFVYLVRNYLEPGKVGWLYPEVKENVLKRAITLEPLLIGKPAPNLILLDTANVIRPLQEVKARYTLLLFWESICGHCQQEMPKIKSFYDKFHMADSLEIFAVSIDTSLVKWKAYIQKNSLPWINVNGHLSISGNYYTLYDIRSTPITYLLDDKKRIIAKFLMTDDLEKVITRREEERIKATKTID